MITAWHWLSIDWHWALVLLALAALFVCGWVVVIIEPDGDWWVF